MKSAKLPEVTLSEDGEYRYLHLGSIWVQGSMRISQPFDLHLEYIQRMMAGLLYLPEDALRDSHAMQLGLGSAALTKFCHKRLKWRTTAIELNPAVRDACHHWFKLPSDDARLQVVISDARKAVATVSGSISLLQVDLYDHDASAPAVDSQAFYRDCFHALADGGVMSVNLFGRMASFGQSVAKITAAFGAGSAIRIFKPTREGNQVVLAQRTPPDWTPQQLIDRADFIESKYKLPARKWLKNLRAQSG